MLPNKIKNCAAIFRMGEFLQRCGFQKQDERGRGSVFHAIAVEANSRSNEMSRQQ